MTTTTSNTLGTQAANVIANADFRDQWPIKARLALVRAAKTEGGSVPPYAVSNVEWALRVARRIERSLSKDIERGEASLSQADRRRLAKV